MLTRRLWELEQLKTSIAEAEQIKTEKEAQIDQLTQKLRLREEQAIAAWEGHRRIFPGMAANVMLSERRTEDGGKGPKEIQARP
jgi:uncharacterized coiled-coil protein SlyX